MIKGIIFDMGGVLLQNKAEAVYKKLAEILEINHEELEKLQKQHKEEMLNGKVSAKEFSDIIKDKFGLEEDIVSKWRETYLDVMPINEELIDLAKNLKKNYKVGIISNVPELHAQINKERGIFSHFEPALISCDIGLIKPQEEIFNLALKKIGLSADECIFIDDRREHLEIPKNRGFIVIEYKNNQQLFNELKKLKIDF